MTERRRPLENDDGQGALFGGEAFAPSGPAPAWKRPGEGASRPPESVSAPPSPEARVELDAPTESNPSPSSDAAGTDVHTRGPDGFEPGTEPGREAPLRSTAAPASPSPFADEIAELERATERHSPRRPQAPLAGPTLDDVMSRVWEGLVTGLPAACPVCQGEVVPALSGSPQGRCASCGTTID